MFLPQETSTLLVNPGETMDVIVDTAGIEPGTYFLYTTNLYYLNNDQQDLGGVMTEIVIEP